jgi:hypothetical protein
MDPSDASGTDVAGAGSSDDVTIVVVTPLGSVGVGALAGSSSPVGGSG